MSTEEQQREAANNAKKDLYDFILDSRLGMIEDIREAADKIDLVQRTVALYTLTVITDALNNLTKEIEQELMT